MRETWESYDQKMANYNGNEEICKIHNKPLENFCSACEVPICLKRTCREKHHIVCTSGGYQRGSSQRGRKLEGAISLDELNERHIESYIKEAKEYEEIFEEKFAESSKHKSKEKKKMKAKEENEEREQKHKSKKKEKHCDYDN